MNRQLKSGRFGQVFAFFIAFYSPLSAQELKEKEPQVPMWAHFQKSLDLEVYGHVDSGEGDVSQNVRLRTRYVDPQVNALVGLVFNLSHFNAPLEIGKLEERRAPELMGSLGLAAGLIRGRHLWELNLMGTLASDNLGFGLGLIGEHSLGKHWAVFHRMDIHLLKGDSIVDADQGLMWKATPSLGVTAGYRVFAGQRMNRNGPRAGLRLLFNSPRIPFLFPSLG